MPSFDQLEELKNQTQAMSAKPMTHDVETPETDEDYLFIDPESGNTIFYKGSSSEVQPNLPARFETDPNPSEPDLEECLCSGLGIKKSMHRGLRECLCGDGCECQYCVGDRVQMPGVKCILIVNNADGENIGLSIPDCIGQIWDKLSVAQNEIQPLSNVPLDTIDDLKNIISFNKANMESFDGHCSDATPMDNAQAAVQRNQHETTDESCATAKERLQEIFGSLPFETNYTDCAAKYATQTMDGKIVKDTPSYKTQIGSSSFFC